jgi:hypothetical protein
MYASQYPWRELHDAILEHDGEQVDIDVLERWWRRNRDEIHWLAEFARRTATDWSAAEGEDLCRLYAIFRVTSTLLLRFQSFARGGSQYGGPAIDVDGFRAFHERLGFQIATMPKFHPFFHEIVEVIPEPDPNAPIELLEERWPALMLGDLMFCRAGCAVSGGTLHVNKEIAESSKLYWTYRRKDRRCNDQSHGWGSNSQWRTGLRRDYRSRDGYHYNVDARQTLVGDEGIVDDAPVSMWVELLRHRCLIRSSADDSDLYPYRYRFFEPHDID